MGVYMEWQQTFFLGGAWAGVSIAGGLSANKSPSSSSSPSSPNKSTFLDDGFLAVVASVGWRQIMSWVELEGGEGTIAPPLIVESFIFEEENKFEYEIWLEVFAPVLKKKHPAQSVVLVSQS